MRIRLGMLITILLVSTLLLSHIASTDVNVTEILVRIKSNGIVVVEIRGSVSEGFNFLHLPITPIPISIEVYINDTLIPTIYANETLYIPSVGKGALYIRYIANTTSVDGKVVFSIANETVKLIIEPSIILLSIPERIISVNYDNSNLVIEVVGPTTIEYTVVTRTTPKSTETIITPTKSTASTTPTAYAPFTLSPMHIILIISIVTITMLLLFIMKRQRSKLISTEVIAYGIDETDKQILHKLEEFGGEAFQSDIQKALNIPKATLWRHVKKLEKLGYIEIRKELRANKLILKKKLKE